MKLKILSLLVAMLAIVMLFASCGGGGDDSGSGDGGSTGGGSTASNQFIVQLYENSNKGELTSGLKRYYAGGDETYSTNIDDLITARNKAANEYAGVNPVYDYKTQYAWGESVDYISDLVKSGYTTTPDIFCNYAYDLTAIALRGHFANLFTNTVAGLETNGTNNYFRFTDESYQPSLEGYFDSRAGEGYFFDYMKSLAFANSDGAYTKMYCLASDYTLDVVRAFLVMPVNVTIMNHLSMYCNEYATDRNNDGKFDITDFYDLVWDGEWTYDVLAAFANSAYVPGTGDNANTDMTDTVIGAAFGRTSGLTAAGLLYSSSVKIIEKTFDANGCTYYYPNSNEELGDFAAALNDLFSKGATNGICSVSTNEAIAAGLFSSVAGQGDLAGIRVKFAKNEVLFGGIIAIGSVETNEFKSMNADGGFGIVPVPLYRDGDDYLTVVHNIARVVAIAKTTTEFEQCTKFLDYQSRNSASIINTYYNNELVAQVNGLSENVEMLGYIRDHVRDCFDNTYEDIISAYLAGNGDENAYQNKWHIRLKNQGYMYTALGEDYKYYYGQKQGELEDILAAWDKLSVPR